MTTVRIDDPWVTGKAVVGEPGLGVLGSGIPSTGQDGASILYNDISLPSEANDYFRLLLTSIPSGLTIFVYEDGSFEADAVDGIYSVGYTGYKNGTSYGSTTAQINIGTAASSIGPVGLSTVSAFGTAALTFSVDIPPSGITSAEAIGTAVVSADTAGSLSPTGITSAEAFGTASFSSVGVYNVSTTGINEGFVGRPRVSSNLVTIFTGTGSASVAIGSSVGSASVGGSGVTQFFSTT